MYALITGRSRDWWLEESIYKMLDFSRVVIEDDLSRLHYNLYIAIKDSDKALHLSMGVRHDGPTTHVGCDAEVTTLPSGARAATPLPAETRNELGLFQSYDLNGYGHYPWEIRPCWYDRPLGSKYTLVSPHEVVGREVAAVADKYAEYAANLA